MPRCVAWVYLFVVGAGFGRADSLAEALQSARYQEVLVMTDALLAAQPGDLRALTARGMALGGLGRDQEGIGTFEEALQVKPDFLPALRGAVEVGYRSRDKRTPALLRRLLQLVPDDPVAHAMAAVFAYEVRDCPLAIRHFEHSLSDIVSNVQAYPLYGECLLQTGRPQEAVRVFEQTLARNSGSAKMRFLLGYSQLTGHHAAEAWETLKPLAESQSAGPDELNLLASAALANGQWQAAVTYLRRAVLIAPKDERNYVDMCAIYIQQNALDQANDIVEAGVGKVPDSARLHTLRGIIRFQTGMVDEAAAEFELANRIDSRQEYGAAGLGLLYTATKQTDAAVSLFRERLKEAPGDFLLNYLLAQALMEAPIEAWSSEFHEARKALETSLRAKPDYVKAQTSLGELYATAGENDKALEHLQMAIQRDPKDRKALSQMAIVLRRLGRAEEAKAVLANLKRLLVQEAPPWGTNSQSP